MGVCSSSNGPNIELSPLAKQKVAEKLGVDVNKIVFVLGGSNSLQKGYDEAVAKKFTHIHLMAGTHVVKGDDYMVFEHPMTVSGDGRDKTFVEGNGFQIKGAKNQNCTFMDLTVQKTEANGMFGCDGMSYECLRLHFDKCGNSGVSAYKTKGRLTNCQVTNCHKCGIVSTNGTMEIEGEETRIDNNGTHGSEYQHGLQASAESFIHLLAPLTKEGISTNNNGGGNYGGPGTIETVNSF